jgi:predicted SnoaL-like aldol condensation-catalyzing enzyme
VLAEGNFVFVHSSGEFGGKKVVFADLMRVENGKIVEHWDAIQDDVPATKTKSGHDMYSQVSK